MSDEKPHGANRSPSAELVRKVELLISNLLRIGVIASLIIVVAGLIVSFTHHPTYLNVPSELKQAISPARMPWNNLAGLLAGLKHFRGEAIIMAGLLLLIATPVMRVAVSIVAFFIERDWVFVAITSFVLAMLILSFFLGRVEG